MMLFVYLIYFKMHKYIEKPAVNNRPNLPPESPHPQHTSGLSCSSPVRNLPPATPSSSLFFTHATLTPA